MAGVAQDEIRKLSSRVKFGHKQAIKNGVVLGNSHLYGYHKQNGRLTICDEEAEMVRFIFENYASGKMTTPKIEKALFEMGYRNYKGGKSTEVSFSISSQIRNIKATMWVTR